MKRILKASAAFALATTLIFSGAGMASATEEVTPTPEVSAEAQVTETPAPAVEEAVVPEEVTAPAPAEVVETPEVAPAPAAPQAEVTTTDAQPQAPPVAAKKPRETYVTALWEGTDVQWPKGGQTLFGSVKHDDKALNKSWIKYQELKPCTVYQGDLYVDDKITKALLKGGKLYGPNRPKESWPDGVYQGSYSVVFKTPCDIPVTGQPVISVTTPTCEANVVNVSWTIPAGLSIAGYTGTGTKTAAELGLNVGDNTFPVDVTKGYSYNGPATVTVKVPPLKTDEECVTPAVPTAVITAVCGSADLTLTNPASSKYGQITASFVVNVDGKFHKAYSVEAGKTITDTLTFAEDTGIHKVEVFQSGTSEWKSIAKATVESDCIPPKPDTKIEFTEWVDGEYECSATEVPQTRTKSVTTYELVDNKWVAQAPVVTTDTQTRPLTEAEQEAADIECAGPQPENKVTHTEWVTGEYVCGDTTVQITRSVTSTEYVLVEGAWVPEGESETTTQTETRDLTAEEIAELECPVVVPPVETCDDFDTQEEAQAAFDSDPVKYAGLDGDKDGLACDTKPTDTPEPTPAPEVTGLAATGGELPLVLGGLGVLALIAGGVAIYLSRRKKATEVADSVDAE